VRDGDRWRLRRAGAVARPSRCAGVGVDGVDVAETGGGAEDEGGLRVADDQKLIKRMATEGGHRFVDDDSTA
jgi:hypothetical protein